jgi:pimeloyl-ACP methyl ester carboxylesterase
MSQQALLVHGGHAGAWAWDGVITELQRSGVAATAIDLPSRQRGRTLADDERAVREALEDLDGPVVLVGHSYSGAVITAASAGNDKVAHLVYVAAALPQEGQSVASALRGEPQPQGNPPADSAEDWTKIEPEAARAGIYNDATDEQFETVRQLLGYFSYRALTEIPSGIGWREHPSTYLISTLDKSFPLETQRRFAANTTYSIDIEAGHAPMLTKPVAVAAAIAAIAGD